VKDLNRNTVDFHSAKKFLRESMASLAAKKGLFRHSERNLRSEESLFSWVSAKERFLASLGMTNHATFFAASSAVL
jgi:hypothetical protein